MAVGKLSQSNPSPLFTQKRENNGLESEDLSELLGQMKEIEADLNV